MEKKSLVSLAAILLFGAANAGHAARNNDKCEPTSPTTCYPEDCKSCYCLGPENYGVNAPACPITCNGDWLISLAGFYWNSHQDGMEYAIKNSVAIRENALLVNVQELNNIISADFETPNYKWDFGFKLGIGFCTTCDGWDFGGKWTWYRGKANGEVEAEQNDNRVLLPLWSAFSGLIGGPEYASDIEHHWKLEMNLVDIELGRNFWTSKYLAIRPHMGLRIAFLNQDFELDHKGGSWLERTTDPTQPPLNNFVEMTNDFKGVGIRGGFDSNWNFGCGWALYGNLATAIVYGRFDVDYNEINRLATSPHDKTPIANWEDNFRASRAMLDLGIGIQWTGMFCDCQYGLTVALGWEHHMFFNQNQLWRINRVGNTTDSTGTPPKNNTGENVYSQRRGDLDTQGWTLSLRFAF